MTAGRRAPDGQTTLARGCATGALQPRVHRVSVAHAVAPPPHCRRTSVAHPSSVRRAAAFHPSLGRNQHLQNVFASSACRCNVVKSLSSSPSPSQSSHHRRMLVAPSSRRRRTVVALSSHRRRIVVASSSHRRRVVVATSSCCHFPAVKTPPLILETIPHMSSELR